MRVVLLLILFNICAYEISFLDKVFKRDSNLSFLTFTNYQVKKSLSVNKTNTLYKYKEEITIEKLKKEKEIRDIIILICFFLIILILIFFSNRNIYRQKKEIKSTKLLDKEISLSQQRNEFIGNRLYELKNPITIVTNSLEMLSNISNKKDKESIETALRSIKKINSDTNYLLGSLKKNSSFLLQNNLQTTSIKGLINRIILEFFPVTNSKNIKIIHETLIPKNLHFNIDQTKVKLILDNFITNALESSNEDIIIKTAYENDKLLFSITDFGKGLKKEEYLNVFEKNDSTKDFEFGLSKTKKIVSLMNGEIILNNTPNKGTTFVILIPVARKNSKYITDKNSSELIHLNNPLKPIKSDEKKHVLIVDNDKEILNFYKLFLEEDYHCTFALNAIKALKKAKKQQFDIIISDVYLPYLNGYEFMNLIKQLPNYLSTPFMFVSGEKEKLKALKLGTDDYITKPFNIEELKLRIKNILHKDIITSVNNNEEKIDPFIKKVMSHIDEHIANPELNVSFLAYKANYSRRQFTRIIKKHTGISPSKFILEQRLKKAYILLNSNVNNRVSDVQHQIGLSNASYFNLKFKEKYGINPSDLTK